jgi:hypothetical protein
MGLVDSGYTASHDRERDDKRAQGHNNVEDLRNQVNHSKSKLRDRANEAN